VGNKPLFRRPQKVRELKRGEASLIKYSPLPFVREGGQGDRLLNNPIIPAIDTDAIIAHNSLQRRR
jgi:hypothetical protein